MNNEGQSFTRFMEIERTLRAPGGCPWDAEQTPESVRANLVEECYECVEAVNDKDAPHVREEMGDIFSVVFMMALMYEEAGDFTLADVFNQISDKLVRRHPHVFGDAKVENSAQVLDNWAKIKVEQEGRKPKDRLLDNVSTALPPLERAYKLQKKAAKAGFDWPDAAGVLDKIAEEAKEAAAATDVEAELGDLLFSVINLCRFLGIDPSNALQRTNTKFTRRFNYIEEHLKNNGLALSAENASKMEDLWQEAKKQEARRLET